MPEDVIASTEDDGLAGEYVLGTLDAQERAAAQQRIAADADFAAKVKVWERRLGELHLMVEPLEPEPAIWARIKARLPESAPEPVPKPVPEPVPEPEAESAPERQDAPAPEPVSAPGPQQHLPELKFDFDFPPPEKPAADAAPEPHAPAEPAEPAAASAPDVIALPSLEAPSGEVAPKAATEVAVVLAPPTPPASAPAPLPPFVAPKPRPAAAAPVDVEQKVRSLRRHLAGWRAVAAVMALALIALAGLIAVWRYAPDRLPPQLRPVALMRLAGISVETRAPPRKPLPPESQFDE